MALLVAAALSSGCQGQSGKGAPDAGRVDAAAPRIVPIRVGAPGELLADLDESRVTVAVIKDRNAALPVTATIALGDGRVMLDGPSPSARLTIDLGTFDSNLPLRNDRVKQFFFETNNRKWETAELVIPSLPAAALSSLRETRRALHVKLDAELTFHGTKRNVELLVDAAYEPGGVLVVKTAAPFDLNVSDYGLEGNLKRLSLLCKHDSIDDIVKVEATIKLTAK